jgi:hypothetical protein
MDAVVRRDTTFTLRLDAFDGNTSRQAPVAELIPDSAAPKQLKLFWLGAGNRDPLMRVSQGLTRSLMEKDVPHIWRLDGNAHDTAVMSANFYHFAPRLFKD